MPWDALEDEINEEFASFERPDITEDELWRRHRAKAAGRHAKTMRAAALPTERTCGYCSAVLTTIAGSRGPLSDYCSKSHRNMASRQRVQLAGLSPIRHAVETTCHNTQAPEPEDRNA